MERDSFIFYRSFHEAIKCMSEKVRAQLYVALADYALDAIEPDNLSGEAKGMFMLMKPIIDANNSRYSNGRKGAQFGKLGGRPRKKPAQIPVETVYSKSFRDEAEQMKGDEAWIDALCMQTHTEREEILRRIEAFPIHCEAECSDKPHKDYADAKKHFCSWMRKAYVSPHPNTPADPPSPPDYSFNGGFGGID